MSQIGAHLVALVHSYPPGLFCGVGPMMGTLGFGSITGLASTFLASPVFSQVGKIGSWVVSLVVTTILVLLFWSLSLGLFFCSYSCNSSMALATVLGKSATS